MDRASQAGLCTYARWSERRKKEANITLSFPFQEQPRRGRIDPDTDTKSQTKHGESGREGGDVPSVSKVQEGRSRRKLESGGAGVSGWITTNGLKHLARGHTRRERHTTQISRARPGDRNSVDHESGWTNVTDG